MPKITLDNQSYSCSNEQTLLEALLSQNVDVPYGCRQGICHSCLMRSMDAVPPDEAQVGLKDAQVAQNHFLACQCYPEQDMQVSLPGDTETIPAVVISNEKLTDEITRLVIQPDELIDFRAGQFVNLQREDGVVRSYSIANTPNKQCTLEFHIRKLVDGQFSQWAYDELKTGDHINVHSPLGECFYVQGNPEQNLLLIGTGTGLAPLAGIISDALNNQHRGSIHLFHGSREQGGLYLIDSMRALAQQHSNFQYTPCVSQEAVEGFSAGRADAIALESYAELNGWRVYLCGHPEMVKTTQQKAFLAGAKLQDIYADAFLVGDNQQSS